MKETEVNKRVKKWIIKQGYRYKKEVPILFNQRELIIDHYGQKLKSHPAELIWVESKGDVRLMELLQGFIKVVLAVYYGSGTGMLALPNKSYKRLKEMKDFLSRITEVVVGKGYIKLLNVEKENTYQL